MQSERYFFVVWARRSADSIFGPGSNAVMRNGALLCFNTDEEARAEADRLNARSGSYLVRYGVRPIRIQTKLPNAIAKGPPVARRRPVPVASTPRPAAPHAA